MGIAFAVSAIAGLVGAPISGALLGDDYAWWKPAVFAGVRTPMFYTTGSKS